MASLELQAQRLLQASLAQSTWVSYRRSIAKFEDFRRCRNLGGDWPVLNRDLAAYNALMTVERRASSSVCSLLSAVSFVHKINGWVDPTANFLVKNKRRV